jgi:hypothetical protein
MHQFGRAQTVNIIREGGSEVLVLENPNYDFNKQHFTKLAGVQVLVRVSKQVKDGDTISVFCSYNTAEASEAVPGCEESGCEMCIVALAYYPFIPDGSGLLTRSGHVLSSARGRRHNARGLPCTGGVCFIPVIKHPVHG